MQVRPPAVAGAFYPAEENELRRTICECVSHRLGPGSTGPRTEKIFGMICPHAGYVYSGPVASHSYRAIREGVPELFVIVGPNHWGIGSNVATMSNCVWRTPLGDVEVDSEAAGEIYEASGIMDVDSFSHTREHSIEVQLPMIQEITDDFRMVPVSLIDQSRDSAGAVGSAIAGIAERRETMIVGSSDFTHYEPREFAYEQDMALIAPILDLDVDGFYDTLQARKVSACGYGAVASTMVACKRLGATRGELLKYATSGDITGDVSSVVGYGSIIFT